MFNYTDMILREAETRLIHANAKMADAYAVIEKSRLMIEEALSILSSLQYEIEDIELSIGVYSQKKEE